MRRGFTRHARRSGFTLLEVVLAVGILVLGMSMILGVFNFGTALTRTAELRSLTSGSIEALVHDLEETLFPIADDGTVGEPVDIEDRPVPGQPGVVYSVEAVGDPRSLAVDGIDADGLPREYHVTISVRWESAGVQRTESWSTIMLREVPFGARMRKRFVQ